MKLRLDEWMFVNNDVNNDVVENNRVSCGETLINQLINQSRLSCTAPPFKAWTEARSAFTIK